MFEKKEIARGKKLICMNESNLKTLFTCSEYILGAQSCKKTVQRANLDEKIQDQKMRDRRVSLEQRKQKVAKFLITNFFR